MTDELDRACLRWDPGLQGYVPRARFTSAEDARAAGGRDYPCLRCGFWHRARRVEQSAQSVRIDCWCIGCDSAVAAAQDMNGDYLASMQRIFIVCPDCGNKRCPRAAHHDQACTGSNEPGQPGSAYPRPGRPVYDGLDEFMAHLDALDMEPAELEKAELSIAYGETVVLVCPEHRGWEESVIDLADALDMWKIHYEEAHTGREVEE